mmetsp:Transcript_22989/g.33645  ORF Transcript_22989/g.33645 Transcript_22989/m.33645 type:complete len:288 (+) Transcript_22989:100-963(+)|eukprot:CAMPEP_0197244568 /NCGR_PEP_ID=MMETSP1429-20130617/9649_1 /TAXON_ID=49237 /ORGANISM="Chaetoceros  sp., Strain UNC1202" /LENGTH=287 /DNA_ID=CAMNT_0042704945 /DNA_START=99 /DNA_END=962 /DNA_ORIENTATION=+
MSELNYLNYLNLVGYIINVFVTFGGAPIFGFPDNAELSDKYQTIISPAGLTFSIWGIIFLAQGIFTIAQMLKDYRAEKLVQEGVSYWYFVACLFQSAWTFAFGYEILLLSTIFMFAILVGLVFIVIQQSKIEVEDDKNGISFYWLLKFPFSIHCGWILAAFAVNVNVYVESIGAGAGMQEVCGYLTLVYAVIVAALALFYLSPPDFTISSVLAWAALGIVLELKDPKDSIKAVFDEAVINRFYGLALALCIILAITTAAYGGLRVYNSLTASKDKDYEGSAMSVEPS